LFADPNTPISQVLDYIRVNLRENHAQKPERESLYEHRFFGKELGMSPIEFVISEKLKCAKQLLKTLQYK
jgi:transcriptional regulator GlxA family with amidase domain